jgi:hypothetical protein
MVQNKIKKSRMEEGMIIAYFLFEEENSGMRSGRIGRLGACVGFRPRQTTLAEVL